MANESKLMKKGKSIVQTRRKERADGPYPVQGGGLSQTRAHVKTPPPTTTGKKKRRGWRDF